MKKCNHSNPDCIRCSFEDCEEKKKLYEKHNINKSNEKTTEADDDTDSSTYLSLLSYIP